VRFTDLVSSAIAATWRSKLRTVLTVLAIFIGAFTLTITSAIGTGISSYISTQVASLGAGNILTVTKTAAAPSSTGSGPAKYDPSTSTGPVQGSGRGGQTDAALSSSDLSTIRNVTGVGSVTPSARISPDYIEYGTHGKYVLQVNGNAQFVKADLAAGRQLDQSASAPQIILPTTYLHNLGFGRPRTAVGSTVTIGISDYLGHHHSVRAAVVGVQNASLLADSANLNRALRDRLVAAQTQGRPASVKTGYASAVVTYSAGDLSAVKRALKADGYSAETVADQLGTFTTVINAIVGVLDAFAVIALIAAAFGIVNTLLMSVQERTREIGLMKAMGMRGGRIYALFSLEAIFIGFLGSAIGAAVAIGIGTLGSRALARGVLSGLPGLHLLLFSPTAVLTIVLVVMAIAFLAGTLPARRAARLDPIEALRYE
jgi:putative ABC transport system permease protein